MSHCGGSGVVVVVKEVAVGRMGAFEDQSEDLVC
jgi:hypothetical protein